MSTDNSAALISVVMPCFNSEKYLEEAIESVLGQTYANVELIVVDDGSTDNSSLILERYASRITLVRQQNKGPMHARNRGIREATGEFVAFLDSDDFWRPDCLELLHNAHVASNPVIAYCGWQNIGPGDFSGPPHVPPDYEEVGKITKFLTSCPWPIHAALTRRTAIVSAGGFTTHYDACEDYDLWLRIGGTHKVALVPEVLAYYRHHSAGQVSRKRWLAAYSMLRIKKDFLAAHPDLRDQFSGSQLRDLLKRPLIEEGFKCYWKRDLDTAREIFHYALFLGGWRLSELKYILPCFLPYELQKTLLR